MTSEQKAQSDLSPYNIRPEIIEILTPENFADFHSSVQAGNGWVYEILVDLETDRMKALSFLEYLTRATSIITNRTAFINNQPWLCMLATSREPADKLAAALKKIDPEESCVTSQLCNRLPYDRN